MCLCAIVTLNRCNIYNKKKIEKYHNVKKKTSLKHLDLKCTVWFSEVKSVHSEKGSVTFRSVEARTPPLQVSHCPAADPPHPTAAGSEPVLRSCRASCL